MSACINQKELVRFLAGEKLTSNLFSGMKKNCLYTLDLSKQILAGSSWMVGEVFFFTSFFSFSFPLAYLRMSKHKVYSGAPRWGNCLQGISLSRVRGFTRTSGESVRAKVNRATITLPVGTHRCWREAPVHGNISAEPLSTASRTRWISDSNQKSTIGSLKSQPGVSV